LRVGQHAIGVSNGDGSDKIIMTADLQGHFYTTGTDQRHIGSLRRRYRGDRHLRWAPTDARRVGLDLRQGQRGMTSTANGQVVVTQDSSLIP
jgi:aspartyl protease family protein